jgi:hypothetical protein
MAQVAERDSADVRQPVTEEPAWFLPGVRMLVLGVVLILGGIAVAVWASHLTGIASVSLVLLTVVIEFCGAFTLGGLTPVSPGHARVIQLFGRYCGAIRDTGLKWVNPFTKRLVVAVGMVRIALQRLQDEGVVELDEERKAAMVSNLLVVLGSEQATQQVVITGTLYQ